jgi:tRNA (cytidine/uridine-2'-O-)-methyltransferase
LNNNPFFNVVLFEPEIPNNTGNIGRTCVGANCRLHLVGNLGFEISDREVKRAGLDYWQHLSWKHHTSFDELLKEIEDQNRIFYFSTHAETSLFEAKFKIGDWLVFGPETKGLPKNMIQTTGENDARVLQIPQFGPIRSLNLANAVSVAVYEGIRQTNSFAQK